MSTSSPESSLSATSSSSCNKDDEEFWEENPPTPPSSISRLNSLDCWDYTIELECLKGPEDLQLAAELGKTLLERNKELEGSLKAQQSVIGEQTQEIDFLTKQAAALREVNDSRLRIYENIEVSIHDLESENHRLLVENGNSKKHNKTLLHNIECLEGRCEEMTRQMDDLNRQIDMERRKNERLLREKDNILQTTSNNSSNNKVELKTVFNHSNNIDRDKDVQDGGKDPEEEEEEEEKICFALPSNLNDEDIETLISNLNGDNVKNEHLVKVLDELVMTKRQYLQEQRRVSELEEQLNAIIQENQTLQSHISKVTSNEEMKSMHDELSILEEVRQGKMCSRCMRTVNDKITESEDGVSSMVETEDGNDSNSFMDLLNTEPSTYRTSVTIKEHQLSMNNSNSSINNNNNNNNDSPLNTTDDTTLTSSLLDSPSQNRNPYRELVEKYEALLEIHNRNSINRSINNNNNNNNKQFQQQSEQQYCNNINNTNTSKNEDELTSGDFSSINTKDDMDLKSMSENRSNSNDFQNQNINNNMKKSDTHNNGAISNNGISAGNRGNGTRMTPTTDFSEAETSSSGFLDETSNKCTQTDETFLCTIADGDDKFSIYDDAGPIIDARFRNRPEYRELFKEIFAILKKAAENKDDGEKLPLLDDSNQILKVPPVTPAVEELPMFPDDTESVISSIISEQSIAMSERITKQERKEIYDVAKKHIDKIEQINNKHPTISGLAASNSNGGTGTQQSTTNGGADHTNVTIKQRNKLIQKEQLSEEQHLQNIIEGGRILTPYKRQPLEYLAVSVNVRKRNNRKKGKQNMNGDRPNSPNLSSTRFYNMGTTGGLATTSTIGSGSFAGGSSGGTTTSFGNTSGRKRREFKSQNTSSITNSTHMSPSQNQNIDWNGTSMTIYNRHACAGAQNNNGAVGGGNQLYSPATSSNYSYKSRGIGGSGTIRRQNNSATDIGDFDVSNSDLANYRRTSTASQDLHKLIKLDLSYAEVLRRADQSSKQHNTTRRK